MGAGTLSAGCVKQDAESWCCVVLPAARCRGDALPAHLHPLDALPLTGCPALLLPAHHKCCSNREEVVRLQKRAPGEATPPPSARSVSALAGQAAEATRALGFAEAKRVAGGLVVAILACWCGWHPAT